MANHVFGASPDVQLGDVTFPPCPPGAPGPPDTCIKVDAFRNLARGNPLPMFFGKIVGVQNQGVRGTATAQIVTGDTTECLKPWAIIDRWDEYDAEVGSLTGRIQIRILARCRPLIVTPMVRATTLRRRTTCMCHPEARTAAGPGSHCRPTLDGSSRSRLIRTPTRTVSAGWFRAIRLPRLDGQNGGDVYRSNIESCGGLPSSYADPGTVCPE